MSAVYEITVSAYGSCLPIPLLATQDESLEKSLISTNFARQTRGSETQLEPMTLTDSQGQVHEIRGCIVLRWYFNRALRSCQETFYIVEDCGYYGCILRKDISVGFTRPALGCNILINDSEAEEQKQVRELRTAQVMKERTAEMIAKASNHRQDLPTKRPRRATCC